MIQTYLFLTQTSLELDKIQQNLAQNFFDTDKIEINLNPINTNLWEKHRNSGQIILFEPTDLGTDSKKETFKKFLQNDVWVSYANTTLLFLGDLSQYSESLQEGMLKLLEEPPKNLVIIIFAQNLSRIKPTIISRSRIQSIPTQIVFQNLSLKIVEKVKKLPEPSIVVKNLLGNIKVEVDKVSDYEREEIDMWLWQIETNLGMLYKEKPENKIAESITKVLRARQLNDQNLQKKFSIGWLNT
jgi:DNA polymerase III, delta subunit